MVCVTASGPKQRAGQRLRACTLFSASVFKDTVHVAEKVQFSLPLPLFAVNNEWLCRHASQWWHKLHSPTLQRVARSANSRLLLQERELLRM